MELHTNILDPDFHQQDAKLAVRRRQLIEADNPWCQCQQQHGGIVTCRRCGRLRNPGPKGFAFQNKQAA